MLSYGKNRIIFPGDFDRNTIYESGLYRSYFQHTMKWVEKNGRDHAPTQSISDDMPEVGGGGESAVAPTVSAKDDDDGDGDGDPDSDRRRSRSKKSLPSFPPALLGFEPLSHYVGFGRSRIYQLINAGEFPPPIKVGKSSRWLRAEIDAWIKQQTAQRVGG